MEAERIKETSSGYILPNGDTLLYGDKRIKFSVDGQFHWCHARNPIGFQSTYCLYVPGRGT